MTSIFYSLQEEQELIVKNIKQLLTDRNIKITTNLLNLVKNHQLVIDNDFLIAYLNDSKANIVDSIKKHYDKGIIIWDRSKFIKPDEKYYNMHIDTFNKSEFYINVVRSSYVPKHTIVDKQSVLNSYPTINECDYPVIKWYDPIMRYYGGRIGDMVRIERHTVNGINIYYRICK